MCLDRIMLMYVSALFYATLCVAVSRAVASRGIPDNTGIRKDTGKALVFTRDSSSSLFSAGGIHVEKRDTVISQPSSVGDDDVPHSRRRRSTHFSTSDANAIVNKHNEQRGKVSPEASDMKTMVWDSTLATMAQQWSDGCLYEHGNPGNISPFSSIGQNLYIKYNLQSAGTPPNGTLATVGWYNEYVDYNFETNSCAAGRQCGHYTQNVWASTYTVGCGLTFCTLATNNGGTQYRNAWLITCNYGPAGNIVGQKPYTAGPSCTECNSGKGLCYNNLCNDCSTSDPKCECRANCQNCGTLNNDCTCTCADGWHGTDCANVCEDTHPYCGANPGWPVSWCDRPYVINGCPHMCSLCNAANPNFVCNSNIQTQKGVQMLIYGNIDDWNSIQASVLSSLRTSVITYCTGHQSTCCPLANNTVVDFTGTGLSLGDNYPAVTTDYSGAYWILVVGISPLSPGVCAQGDGGIMNPDAVLAAINGDLASIESNLGVDFGDTKRSGTSRLTLSAQTVFVMLAITLIKTVLNLL